MRLVCLLLALNLLPPVALGSEQNSAQATNEQSDTEATIVHAVRTTGDDQNAKFVLDVSKPIAFTLFALSEPYRLVIDLPTMSFQMAHSMGQVERAMVRNFRFGNFGETRSRIVLDLNGPAKVQKAYNLPAVDGNAARAVIELGAVDEREFSQQSLRGMIRVAVDEEENKDPARLAVRPLPKKTKVADPRPLVILDPGHGGIDSGAVSSKGLVESELVLDFALALRDHLVKDGRVRVAMTREKDIYVSLPKRVSFARARHADLFVSIHADNCAAKLCARGDGVHAV